MSSTELENATRGVMQNLNVLCGKMETLIKSNENISETKKEVLKAISKAETRMYVVIAIIQVSFSAVIAIWVK